MIKLVVDPHCDNCPEFEPDVDRDIETLTRVADSFLSREDTVISTMCNTTITCKHRQRCRSIVGYLIKEANKKDEN